MKGDFFDFVVYRIPEGTVTDDLSKPHISISDKNILLFVSDPSHTEVRSKLTQIMSAVGLDESDYDVLPLDLVLPDWKTIMEDHHEKALVFTNNDNRPDEVSPYQVYHLDNGDMAFADDVLRLIKDEQEGITERRKALWLMLKSWLS